MKTQNYLALMSSHGLRAPPFFIHLSHMRAFSRPHYAFSRQNARYQPNGPKAISLKIPPWESSISEFNHYPAPLLFFKRMLYVLKGVIAVGLSSRTCCIPSNCTFEPQFSTFAHAQLLLCPKLFVA